MSMNSNNIKILQYLFLGTMLFLFSCTPKCPQIESITSKGNKVNISMNECKSSDTVFQLNLDLKILENPKNKELYVHIPKEAVQLKKHKDFDYEIDVLRQKDLGFSIVVKLQEGDSVKIKGTDFKRKDRDKKNAVIAVGPSWTTSFEFYGLIQELSKGVYQTKIESHQSNITTLNMFDAEVAGFNEKYSFTLSIDE